MKAIQVFIDGSCEPYNPEGHAHAGVYIKAPKRFKIPDHFSECVGTGPGMSNNVAEYAALNLAIEHLAEYKLHNQKIKVFSDSLLVVNQIKRFIQSNYLASMRFSGLYAQEATRAMNKVKHLPNLSIGWIPRERNDIADSLSRCGYSKTREGSQTLSAYKRDNVELKVAR